jgi:hypothetical protein
LCSFGWCVDNIPIKAKRNKNTDDDVKRLFLLSAFMSVGEEKIPQAKRQQGLAFFLTDDVRLRLNIFNEKII